MTTHLRAVTSEDARPAGSPDECFYCRRKIGQTHAFECVTIKAPRTYRVLLDGQDIGTWTTEDPVSWDRDMRYFHKNESSWCTDNILDVGELVLDGRGLPVPGAECLCGRVELVPIELNEPILAGG